MFFLGLLVLWSMEMFCRQGSVYDGSDELCY